MRLRVAVAVGVLALVPAAPAAAQRPTLGQIEHEVMCPTCHTLLELSHAPIADRMRSFIRLRIAAGDTDAEIKRRLVGEFGEGVLAAPPAHGFGLVAWVAPIGVALAVGAILVVSLRRWRSTYERDRALEPRVSRLDPALAARLDRELAELER